MSKKVWHGIFCGMKKIRKISALCVYIFAKRKTVKHSYKSLWNIAVIAVKHSVKHYQEMALVVPNFGINSAKFWYII